MKTDSNLELAIALSASLRESEMMAKLRETETLLEAGLEKEALSQCKQLEDFGFISSSAAEPNLYKSNSSTFGFVYVSYDFKDSLNLNFI